MAGSIRFGLRLRTVEKLYLDQLAVLEGGLSKAALIRRLIRKAALENGLVNPDLSFGKSRTIQSCSESSFGKERFS